VGNVVLRQCDKSYDRRQGENESRDGTIWRNEGVGWNEGEDEDANADKNEWAEAKTLYGAIQCD
jgi:hypothetical protein